ncbi:hypothetical protein BN2127_JRS1_02824 [Bacillus cereus]|nr:hypothetical protein BN2127_JRS1_02824 [Bacillus cereus]
MFIEIERLLIRKFEFKDWQTVHEYTSDINVMKYIPEEGARNFVNENAKNFSVVFIDKDILIDHIVFYKYFGEHTYEIGWVFNPKYFNKGYASEAA